MCGADCRWRLRRLLLLLNCSARDDMLVDYVVVTILERDLLALVARLCSMCAGQKYRLMVLDAWRVEPMW